MTEPKDPKTPAEAPSTPPSAQTTPEVQEPVAEPPEHEETEAPGTSDSTEPAEATDTTPTKRRKTSGTAGSGRRRPWLVGLLLLLLIGISGLGYWGFQWLQTAYAEQAQALAEMQAQQSQTASELSALGRQLRQSEQAREQLASALREEQQQLEQLMVETAQRLSRRQDLEADRWPLEEALALLRLAERRLQLDGNGDVALRLVNAADQVLSGLTQAAVLPVRRQLARDRLALQAVETPDINGLYFRLAAMADRIRSLTWTPEASVTPEPIAEESLSWQAFMDSLSSIVTITRLDVSHQAAPLLGDFALWQQQSLLLTEQAQLALLAGNQALYEAALSQLNDRLESMQASLPVSELLDEVATLTQARLVPDLPDIHGSIEALEGYMVNLQPDEATNGGDDS